MKAVCVHEFGGPDRMIVEGVADPEPSFGQVVVQTHAIGVNPVDTYIRSGAYHIKPTLPYVPGTDAAGVVESVGEGVQCVRAGDRVYTAGTISGAYAQRLLCDERQVHQLPDEISYSQGAALGVPYSAAYHALLHRARAARGEIVLIHGATGGVGLAAIQWAKAAGMTVIATGGSERGRKLLSDQGVTHVLDHGDSGYVEDVLQQTNGKGVDVILEMRADLNLGKDLGLMAQNGRVVIIGSRGNVEINPRDAMLRNATILGMLLMSATEREKSSIHTAIAAGLKNGTLKPIVGREMPLSDAPRAHQLIMEPGALGKIVLIPER
jgi:NADPH2:quinone reductase